jgi:HEAT repeat protein
MPVTKEQIEKYLNVDEPDYTSAARLGIGALPHLEVLARNADPGLAAKAVYLASLIAGDASASVIDAAARRDDPVIRVAAAAALGRVSTSQITDTVVRLLADEEIGVRLRAVAALPSEYNPELRHRLGQLADSLPQGAHKDQVLDALRKTRA